MKLVPKKKSCFAHCIQWCCCLCICLGLWCAGSGGGGGGAGSTTYQPVGDEFGDGDGDGDDNDRAGVEMTPQKSPAGMALAVNDLEIESAEIDGLLNDHDDDLTADLADIDNIDDELRIDTID